MVLQRLSAQADPDMLVKHGKRTWLVPRDLAVNARDLAASKFPELLSNGRVLLPYRYDSGGHILDRNSRDLRDQIFSHIDPDDQQIRHFHIPKLRQLIDASTELAEFPVTDEQAAFVMQNHTIDESHVLERVTDAMLHQPGLICLFADGSQLIVDGNHRYVKRARLGLPSMQFYLLPESKWRKALLNLPRMFDRLVG